MQLIFHELGQRGGGEGKGAGAEGIIQLNHHTNTICGLQCKRDKSHCHEFLSIEHCFVKPKIFLKAWSVWDDKLGPPIHIEQIRCMKRLLKSIMAYCCTIDFFVIAEKTYKNFSRN